MPNHRTDYDFDVISGPSVRLPAPPPAAPPTAPAAPLPAPSRPASTAEGGDAA
jgi:hypothetical protein